MKNNKTIKKIMKLAMCNNFLRSSEKYHCEEGAMPAKSKA